MDSQNNDTKLIDISTKKHPSMFAIVDADDFDRVNAYKWHIKQGKYVVRKCVSSNDGAMVKKEIQLSREIIELTSTNRIFHINGNSFDFRKSNLSITSVCRNMMRNEDDGLFKIYLSGRDGKGKFAIVDKDSYESLKIYSWIVSCGYAVRRRRLSDGDGGGLISMHRSVVGITGESHIDHISGNRLDNRRVNLRETNSLGNGKNRHGTSNTGYKGVYFEKKCSKPYYAQIMSNGKRFRLGYFYTPKEAYVAYCNAANKLHGEFANTGHASDLKNGNNALS